MPLQLKVTSVAEDSSLVSVDALKRVLSIPKTDKDADEDLQLYVDGATEAIEGVVGRVLRQQTYEERVPGLGSQYLQLSQWPVQQVDSIQYGLVGGSVTTLSSGLYDVIHAETGLVYREDTFPWTVRAHFGLNITPMPSEALPWYVVTYSAGFLPSSSTESGYKVPKDLMMAALDTAKAWWRVRSYDPVIKERKVDDLTVTYRDDDGTRRGPFPELPMRVAAMVSRYTDFLAP